MMIFALKSGRLLRNWRYPQEFKAREPGMCIADSACGMNGIVVYMKHKEIFTTDRHTDLHRSIGGGGAGRWHWGSAAVML